jgi:transcriptional regulator with AAA-type ATPase domain/pSer/pThr/pTyr-binding forkhead associated (FHA) protein
MASLIRLDNGQIFNITNKIDIIGRGSSASVFLDEDGVSRNHAEIFMMGGCVEIIDLNSRNGISVNGEKTRKCFLNNGDKIAIGSVDLAFSNEVLEKNQTVNIAVNANQREPIPVVSEPAPSELLQVRPNDDFLNVGATSLSGPYLEILYHASLELQNYKGSSRFSEVVVKVLQQTLSPSILYIKLTHENEEIEHPVGSRNHNSKPVFDQVLSNGNAYLRKRNVIDEVPSLICAPVMNNKKSFNGALYMETMDKNYELEDLLFVRALLAQASSVNENVTQETCQLIPDVLRQSQSQAKVFSEDELLILGNSEPTNLLKRRIEELASEEKVMISGPPGTNRAIIANNLYAQSTHTDKPYIYVDCSNLDQQALQEELFGVQDSLQKGKFQEAKGGTLFLNRITFLPLDIQAAISLYLENGTITPVGSHTEMPISLQLITGIRGRPENALGRGGLSEDLLAQFAGKRLHIPLLRERQSDMAQVINHFFLKFLKKYNKPGMILSNESELLLNQYPWPGNDRELELIVERAVLCCDHKELTPEYLSLPGK